jgi:hypothetical protein
VRLSRLLSLTLAAPTLLAGCDAGRPQSAPAATPTTATAPVAADPEAVAALQKELSEAINKASIRYLSLAYDYNEELLEKLDRIEAKLAGKDDRPYPRYLAGTARQPGLDEAEELDHFREVFRRWEAKTGKTLRAAIDPLKAEVAARKPGGPPFHPEFQRRFAQEFDTLIKFEVEEMRERRNRALHRETEPLLAKYRDKQPDLVREYESTLNAPPYALPAKDGSARPKG